jgi:AAA15 family ATPase/GTPase
MLLKYRFNNFCSFWGENEFSAEAAQGKVLKRYPENYVSACGCNLFKTMVIVGENAGGKSNFIRSIRFLKSLFAENSKVKTVDAYVNIASLAKDKQSQQVFELEFVPDGTLIYRYRLVIDSQGIVSEGLYYRSNRKSRETAELEFFRDAAKPKVVFGGKAIREYPMLSAKAVQNIGLFAAKLALLGDDHANVLVDWVNNRLSVSSIETESRNLIRQQADLEVLKDLRYIDILRMVDYSVCGIELDEENPYSKTVIIRKDQDGKQYKRELQMDSAGVKEFFAWAVQLYRVVYENKVIFADEMDRVLNPVLSERVVAYINGKEHQGQFIFTTHNVLHLNLITYMKEQIYFVTKSRNTLISELYSLADFSEVRYETTKIYEFYMKGILGGTADE